MSAADCLFENEHTRVIKAKHGAFIYNKNDSFIGRSLETYGEWCEGEIDTLRQIVKDGDVVVDVGANIGTHTIPLAQRVGLSGGILALEAQRVVFQTLCGNVALNNLLNVMCLNVAAGARRSLAQMPVVDPKVPFNWGAVTPSSLPNGEDVEMVALDDLAIGRCRLIKIDTSGAEAEVLEGAGDLISRCSPALFIAVNGAGAAAKVLTQLDRLGYAAWWHITRYFQAANHFGVERNIFEGYLPDANLLCFPRAASVSIEGFEPAVGLDDSLEKAVQRIAARAEGSTN